MTTRLFWLPDKGALPSYIDASMGSGFANCHRKFAWRYVHHIVPMVTPKALAGGGSMHDGLAGIYKAKSGIVVPSLAFCLETLDACSSLSSTIRAAAKQARADSYLTEWQQHACVGLHELLLSLSAHNSETQAALISDELRNPAQWIEVIWAYAKHYEFEQFRPLGDKIELGFSLPIPGRPVGWVGRLDLAGLRDRDSDKYVLMEHKHTARMSAAYWQQWNPNFQISGYMRAGQEYLHPFEGIYINVVVIHKHETLFERQLVSSSAVRVDAFVADVIDLWDDMEHAYKRGPAGFYKNQSHCLAYFRPCEYRDLCTQIHLKDIERRIELDFIRSTWAPYEELVEGSTREPNKAF